MAQPTVSSTSSVVLGVVLGAVLLLWLLLRHATSDWRRIAKSGARTPPGSFGWPLIGETRAFGFDSTAFVLDRVQRYGGVFKSSLFSKPAIIGTTPEFAKVVLSNSTLFPIGWPSNIAAILGPRSFMFKDGPNHTYPKKIVQKSLLPESLRHHVETFETIILKHLNSWAEAGAVISSEATKELTADLAVYLVLGTKDLGATPEGRLVLENYHLLPGSTQAVPINLPGFTFHKALKAKALLSSYINDLLLKRKAQENTCRDILGNLMASQQSARDAGGLNDLDDDTIVDNAVAMLVTAHDTSASALVWVFKYLFDFPDVFGLVQAEQEEIFRSKSVSGDLKPRLTWEDTTNMVYTAKFFKEIGRCIPIAPVMFRKAKTDVEFEGQLIPKGWNVAMITNSLHIDPLHFPDPSTFDPSRFDHAPPKPFTYLPFSFGSHMCPGMEFAKLVTNIFIHHITTSFTYESTAPDQGMIFSPLVIPRGGYPIKIRRRDN